MSLLDKDGRVVVKYVYDAWGNHEVCNPDGNELVDHSHIGYINPFRYRGYYYDTETKLYYLKTRYYDPEVGRFITIDDLSYLDPEHINGLNLYAYCGNNPVMAVDPDGTKWWKWLLAGLAIAACVVGAIFAGGTSLVGVALIGAAIGGSISLVSQAINGGDLSLGKFFLDMGVGAISGMIGASGISRLGSTIAGFVIGGASDIASQLISGTSYKNINWWSVGISAFIGGAAGFIGGAGAKNKTAMDKFISANKAVIKAQNGVAKVGDKLANGLYATVRGAKSAYTQVMNRMSNAIFNAAKAYSISAIKWALSSYGISTALLAVLSSI